MATKANQTKCIFVGILLLVFALAPLFAQRGWSGSRYSPGKALSGKMSRSPNRGVTSLRHGGRSFNAHTQMRASGRNRTSLPKQSAPTFKPPQRSFNRKSAVVSRERTLRVSPRKNSVRTQSINRGKTSSRFAVRRPPVEISSVQQGTSKNRLGRTGGEVTIPSNSDRLLHRTGMTRDANKRSINLTTLPKAKARAGKRRGLNTNVPPLRETANSPLRVASKNRQSYNNNAIGSALNRSNAGHRGSKRGREGFKGTRGGFSKNVRSAYGCCERPHIKNGEHHGYQRFGCYPGQIFYPVVWPTYYYPVYYDSGYYSTFHYVYPYYHRKYVFVSLGGYWPIDYGYVRYYWYGCHPYHWYGYYPLAYEVGSDADAYYTYNTYNYYDDDASEPSSVYQEDSEEEETPVEDSNDLRTELPEEPAKEPQEETLADRYFEEGVKAFEAGDYHVAASKFEDALLLEPDDMVLPFAYVQALIADQQYAKAAAVLRGAVKELPPDQAGVFFPRGLYTDDEILFHHIDRLATKAKLNPFDPDLQLLLGYQFLGVGKHDQAEQALRKASLDLGNKTPSKVMLALLEKIKD